MPLLNIRRGVRRAERLLFYSLLAAAVKFNV